MHSVKQRTLYVLIFSPIPDFYMPPLRYAFTISLVALFLILGCEADAPSPEYDAATDAPADVETNAQAESAQDAYWERMRAQCGNAYPGALEREPEGDEMLDGDEMLIAHWRVCEDDRIEIPFHIETDEGWDRSRTWILTRHEHSLEIRHDHRTPDGAPDETTMYGGFTEDAGTATRQEFLSEERTEETGIWRGWRLDIEPGTRYSYGTVRGEDWSWRVDFDLSEPIDPPPAPWGHEDTPPSETPDA